MIYDKVVLNLAGEKITLLYNKSNREVYNPLFPGVTIHKYLMNCGFILTHNELRTIIEKKMDGFELAIARLELNKAIKDFKDYSDCF